MPPQDSNGEPENEFLNHLFRILLGPYGGENSALDDRLRLVDILALNSEYLRRSGKDANYAARDKISQISVALLDLDNGVTHPIFEAKELGHGPPDSSVVWRSRTTLAIALDYLIEAKVPSYIALKKISETPGIEKLLSKGASAEKSPLNWRTTLGNGVVANEWAREQWEGSRKFIAELTGSPSEKRKVLKAEATRLIAAATEEIGEI
jgi:hypothetical protein